MCVHHNVLYIWGKKCICLNACLTLYMANERIFKTKKDENYKADLKAVNTVNNFTTDYSRQTVNNRSKWALLSFQLSSSAILYFVR